MQTTEGKGSTLDADGDRRATKIFKQCFEVGEEMTWDIKKKSLENFKGFTGKIMAICD